MGFISAGRCQSFILFIITLLKPNAQFRLTEFPPVTKKHSSNWRRKCWQKIGRVTVNLTDNNELFNKKKMGVSALQ